MSSRDLIATRQYEALLPDGSLASVELEIGRPQPTPGQDDWGCTYRITGLPEPVTPTIYGVDALQALLLCLKIVRVEMEVAARHAQLTWLGESELGLG
jgi:hypothetical protein